MKKVYRYYLKQFKYENFKRFFDLFFAIVLIILISPLLVLLCFVIYLNFGFPIIFKQNRPGKKNKVFTIYKFRSMRQTYNKEGILLPDELRLTKFGAWLRGTSMDELPELINIIKGEMSFIGPRPLLIDYLKFYNSVEIKRHNVRPGLTGLAQIKGRNSLSWEERFQFDLFYVENYNLFLDLNIIFKTIIKVIKKEGITCKNMQNFKRDLK